MTEVAYAIIDATGNVINHLISDKLPVLHDPTHYSIVNNDKAGIGWVYKKGKFIDPEDTVARLNAMPPTQLPTSIDDHRKQIASLQADIKTLTASLIAVINTVNTLTRPGSASKK